MKENQEKAAQELLDAANKASGDSVGAITVMIQQLTQALGANSGYVKGTREQHEARANASKDYCLVNRKQLIEELEKVLENGEVQRGAQSEAAEKYNIETFAKIIPISRQVLVNDDLGAFTQTPERLGRKARDLESNELWGLIFSNATLSDGFAFFSSDH